MVVCAKHNFQFIPLFPVAAILSMEMLKTFYAFLPAKLIQIPNEHGAKEQQRKMNKKLLIIYGV